MQLLIVLLGLIVLVYGQRLFWLFVAIAGFLAGMEFTLMYLAEQATWVILSGGLVAGLAGALLAVFVQRAAFILAGFLAGAYLALVVSSALSAVGPGLIWGIAGGLTGAVLSGLLMDRAIIVLSSLVGAGAITGQLELDPAYRAIIFTVLTLIGTYTQVRSRDRS